MKKNFFEIENKKKNFLIYFFLKFYLNIYNYVYNKVFKLLKVIFILNMTL